MWSWRKKRRGLTLPPLPKDSMLMLGITTYSGGRDQHQVFLGKHNNDGVFAWHEALGLLADQRPKKGT